MHALTTSKNKEINTIKEINIVHCKKMVDIEKKYDTLQTDTSSMLKQQKEKITEKITLEIQQAMQTKHQEAMQLNEEKQAKEIESMLQKHEHEINGATEKLEHTNLELRSQSELLTENHQLLQQKYALVLADQKSSENVLVSAKENHVQEIAKKNMELQNMRALILKEHELEMNANYLKLKNAEEKVKGKWTQGAMYTSS
tara:strand:+ start:110 stop:709 length:600 start_codon:yes stop_codon:yes gene_type:complete